MSKWDCQIASDNVAGARMATEYLIEQIGMVRKAARSRSAGCLGDYRQERGPMRRVDEALEVVTSQSATTLNPKVGKGFIAGGVEYPPV